MERASKTATRASDCAVSARRAVISAPRSGAGGCVRRAPTAQSGLSAAGGRGIGSLLQEPDELRSGPGFQDVVLPLFPADGRGGRDPVIVTGEHDEAIV